MTHSAPRATTGTTFTVALIGGAARALASFKAALKNRRQIAQLHHLDDRSLKDIGLMRSDVHEALSASIFHDPSQHLVDVAGEMRSGSKPVSSGKTQQGISRLRHPDAVVTAEIPKGCVSA